MDQGRLAAARLTGQNNPHAILTLWSRRGSARAGAGQAGAAVVKVGGVTYRGTYTLRGGSPTLRVADGGDRLLFTLKATDRKP